MTTKAYHFYILLIRDSMYFITNHLHITHEKWNYVIIQDHIYLNLKFAAI